MGVTKEADWKIQYCCWNKFCDFTFCLNFSFVVMILYTEIYYIMFTGGVVYSDSYSQWHGILKLKRLSVADDRLHLWENKPYYNELSCTFCLFYWKACDVMSWGVSQWSLHHCIEVSPHLFSFFTVYITFTFTTTSLWSQTFFAFLAST